MTASPSVIRIQGLTKTFGAVRALDGLDLEVAPGEVHGFLGPNGAGKSTTIRVVLGLIRASGGQVALFGGDPWSQAAKLYAASLGALAFVFAGLAALRSPGQPALPGRLHLGSARPRRWHTCCAASET